jgi:HPt (histidine-containing phosphotransfer) domain-containing protein
MTAISGLRGRPEAARPLAASPPSASSPASRQLFEEPITVSTLDPQAIEELRSLNPDDDSFLRDLVQVYLDDSPQRIAEIELALAQGDTERLTRAAHSLKGSCANFGASRLRAISEQIEKLGRQGALQEVPARLPELKVAFAQVKADLEALIAPA